ncbi:MAG: polysaccharide deacetylase family protein [Candidatus Pacebacteria bacterium]|nr:polysaccharide deacetylase family protein [Candidatus Paceibacterota bacterium]
MNKITRREFLRRFLGRDGERKKESISEENKETKGIKRREFLKGLIAFLIGLFLLREEKKVEKERENKWQSPGEEYIKSKIEEIFKDVDGPETLGEFYEEHQFYEELLEVPIEEKRDLKAANNNVNVETEIETKVIYGGKPGTKRIAITFDDSANPQMLRKLLEIAKEHQIKMVWFLIGRTVNEEVSEIIKEALDSDLIRLGNHSFSHNISEFSKLNRNYIEKEKTEWIERLKSFGISEENLKFYFRPPGGAGGYRGGDKNLLNLLSQNGYRYLCMWNVEFIYTIRTKFNGDYSKENVLKILKGSIYSRKGGNLILFHFNSVDLRAFIEILPELIKNGYQFVFPEEL